MQLEQASDKFLLRLALRKIFIAFGSPKLGPRRLMFEIVAHAVLDLEPNRVPKPKRKNHKKKNYERIVYDWKNREKIKELDQQRAASYLTGDIYHASLCDVSSSYIRMVINKCARKDYFAPVAAND